LKFSVVSASKSQCHHKLQTTHTPIHTALA